MKALKMIGIGIAIAAAAVVGAGQLGLLRGSTPTALGISNGKLQPPSDNPNSVSSQASLYPGHPQQVYANIDPFRFTGDGETAMAKVKTALQQMSGAVIVTERPDYLYAQCSTPLLKFTDDVEFWLDKSAGVIQIRSASRLGRKDFGVNRARMETIRARLQS